MSLNKSVIAVLFGNGGHKTFLLRSSIRFLWRSPYFYARRNSGIYMFMIYLWTPHIIKAIYHMTRVIAIHLYMNHNVIFVICFRHSSILMSTRTFCHNIMNRDCIPRWCNVVISMGLILREALCNSRNANTCMFSDVDMDFVLEPLIGTIYWCSPFGWLWVAYIPWYVIQLYV